MFELMHAPDDIVAKRYRILHPLGQGGSGITYEAEEIATQQRVALKIISLRGMQDWKQLKLFEWDVQVLSSLEHPAIPKYLDYFQIDSDRDRSCYIAQALAPGKSLAALVEEGWQTTESEVKRIAREILNALIYLHSLTPPIVHQDLKPQNIIRGEDGRISLVDFGVVQAIARNAKTHGSTVIVVGTDGYVAPEQFRGQAYGATDLYGLGATLLFLLTHCHPGDLPQEHLKLAFRDHLQLKIKPRFSDWLDQMIAPLLEDRFSRASEALNALDHAPLHSALRPSHHPVLTTPGTRGKLSRPSGSRIQLQRTRSHLTLDIPPAGLQGSITMLMFCIFWNGFTLLLTGMTIVTLSPLSFVLLYFWIFSLWLSADLLGNIAGRTRLEIHPQTFRLQRQLFKLRIQVQGKTKNLSKVERQTTYTKNHQPVGICTLNEGVRTHKFGSMLSNLEQKWVVQELTTFLEQQDQHLKHVYRL